MNMFRTISSLLLAALVLLASSSFYVGVHSCGGTVKAVAFLNDADGCGHNQLPPCHRKAMEGCCDDEQIVHQSQDLKANAAIVSVADVSSSVILHQTAVLSEIIPTVEVNPVLYFSDHPPALTGNDILISIQSFLI
jgi:hypothetical protein